MLAYFWPKRHGIGVPPTVNTPEERVHVKCSLSPPFAYFRTGSTAASYYVGPGTPFWLLLAAFRCATENGARLRARVVYHDRYFA